MERIGITGGIATGKTSFCACLRQLIPDAAYFDADETAHELLTEIFGDVDRESLRREVFADLAKRRELEQILHPRIRDRWQAAIKMASTSPRCNVFLADIPLLFETGGESLCDRVVVVACSPETQRERLLARGISHSEGELMIAAQLPLEDKISMANHVVWNNGSQASLMAQARLVAAL